MTDRPPPDKRPSAQQLAAQSHGEQPMQIGGKPADVCPYCGAAMFANGRKDGDAMIYRYVNCRVCDKSFRAKQPPAVLMYEVGKDDDVSSSGHNPLTIHREIA